MLLPATIAITFISLLSLIPTSTTSSAQFVNPNPVTDCSNGGIGFFSCPNQPGCCFGGAICCAGGCCPITSWCVNIGQPNEGCCPFSDTNNCGAKVASFSKPPCSATAHRPPKPSVLCVNADDDWYCPPGAVCGLEAPLCHDFFDLGCESSPPEVESPTPTPTPTPRPSGTASGGGGGNGSRRTTTGSQTQSAVGGGVSSPAGVRPLGAGGVVERNVGGILGGLIAGLGLVF